MVTMNLGAVVDMSHVGVRGLAIWQTQEVVPIGNGHLIEIFIGIAALALLAQAIAIVVLAIGGLKAQKALMEHVTEIKAKLMPVVEKTHALVNQVTLSATELAPKINSIAAKVEQITVKAEAISGHVEEISVMVKDKVVEFGPTVTAANATITTANQTVMDATLKTHEQLLRVNEIITNSLDATEKMGKSLRHTVTQPGREVAGIVSGVKAAVTKFFDGSVAPKNSATRPYGRTPYPTADRSREDDLGL